MAPIDISQGTWKAEGKDLAELQAKVKHDLESDLVRELNEITPSSIGYGNNSSRWATNTLTDNEWRAYQEHPETFFGVLNRNAPGNITDPLEFYEWSRPIYDATPGSASSSCSQTSEEPQGWRIFHNVSWPASIANERPTPYLRCNTSAVPRRTTFR